MKSVVFLFFQMTLMFSCSGQSETVLNNNENLDKDYKTIKSDSINSYNMEDILYGKRYKYIDEKIEFLNRVHLNDTLYGRSLPFLIKNSVLYFDKIARLNYDSDTSIILNDTTFHISENTFIQVFLSDKMLLLNNSGISIRERSSYRIFNPSKPRLITGGKYVFYLFENELSVTNVLSGKVIWTFKDKNALGNYFQTEKFLYLSTKDKLLKFDLETGEILFKLQMPYVTSDFEYSNGLLFLSAKNIGLVALNVESNIIEWELKSKEAGVIYLDKNMLYYNCGTLYAIDIQKEEVKWAMNTVAFNGELLVKDRLVICEKYLLIEGFTGADESGATIPLLIDKENGAILNAKWAEGEQSFSFAQKSSNNILVAMKDYCWLYVFKIKD